MCNAGNYIARALDIKRRGGEIIQKKQRLRALHNKVIDAHGDQINADCVMLVDFNGDFQLCAHAVIGGDQNRVLEIAGGQIEQPPKPPKSLSAPGGVLLCQRCDGTHQRIARINVDAGLGIGQ